VRFVEVKPPAAVLYRKEKRDRQHRHTMRLTDSDQPRAGLSEKHSHPTTSASRHSDPTHDDGQSCGISDVAAIWRLFVSHISVRSVYRLNLTFSVYFEVLIFTPYEQAAEERRYVRRSSITNEHAS
jgi:hypothetical protein